MPLHQACYVPALDKIFGAYAGHVHRFNAATGLREASALVRQGAENTSGICYHAATNSLYVSIWNNVHNQYEFMAHPDIDIFPVNPGTMAVGAGLGWSTFYGGGGGARKDWPLGPRMLMDAGSANVHFIGAEGHDDSITWIGFIDPTAPAAETTSLASIDFWAEQISTDHTNVYFPDAWQPAVWKSDLALTPASYDSVVFAESGVLMPVGIEHSYTTNKEYVVCGNEFMARIDTWTPDAYTIFNLDMVVANPDPMRLRYRALDGKLYIPCQGIDTVIVWPSTDLVAGAVAKTGFQSPIDVVFTPTKAWAVQNGPVSLREIT